MGLYDKGARESPDSDNVNEKVGEKSPRTSLARVFMCVAPGQGRFEDNKGHVDLCGATEWCRPNHTVLLNRYWTHSRRAAPPTFRPSQIHGLNRRR